MHQAGKILSAQRFSSFNLCCDPQKQVLSFHTLKMRGTGLVKGMEPGLGAKLLFTIPEPMI